MRSAPRAHCEALSCFAPGCFCDCGAGTALRPLLELVAHFFRSLCDAAGLNLNLRVRGDNDHHKIEASFKALARALRQAIRREGDALPSTKGVL